MKASSLCLFSLCACACFAQEPPAEQFVYVAGGRSYPVLGARDSRLGVELGVQRVIYEPKFRFLGKAFRTVDTFQFLADTGMVGRFGARPTFAAGPMYGLRYVGGTGGRYFVEGSMGFQFDTARTHDLPSLFNFAPLISFGEIVPGKHPIELAIRLMHLSNLYTERPNFGEDFILATVGFSF